MSRTIRYYGEPDLQNDASRRQLPHLLITHLEQLIFVRHCRSLDMTLDGIRILLNFKASPDENCAVVNQLLDERIGHGC